MLATEISSPCQSTAQTSPTREPTIANPSGKFQNKVVLITGATSGIWLASEDASYVSGGQFSVDGGGLG